MGLLERIAAARGGDETRFAIDPWIADYLLPANVFSFNGVNYPFGLNQTLTNNRSREISNTLPGYMAALRLCPPAFAAQMVRALVLSQARFVFRNTRVSRTPGRTFGTSALSPLERPWTNGTTGELLSRMEWHAGLAGNAYVTNRPTRLPDGSRNDRLRVLRPDWVIIVYGSQQQPEDAAHALDGEIIGYIYVNGGIAGRNEPETLLPGEMAHWSPIPDPENAGIGMSWITPAVREIQGDQAATDHKLRFFQNGAPQPLDAKVLTPAGWSTMGAMRVGSRVIGSDGQPHVVTAVYPQGEREIYRVLFNDGASAECTADHLWTVTNNYDRRRGVTRQVTLAELVEEGFHYRSGPAKWAVPMVDPIEYDPVDLPLDPYLLGLLLGDGSFRSNGKGSGGVNLACHAYDVDETELTIRPLLPAGVTISRRDRGGWAELYFRGPGSPTPNPLTGVIRELGLWDVTGPDKFVPAEYLRASVKERVALLQGLIDSDGHVERTGLRLTTTSARLARDVREIVGSVGGVATIHPNKNRMTLTVNIRQLPDWIVPARLFRKATAYRPTRALRVRTMVGAALVRRAQAQCIAVDSADHLYVTDGFILTHNTPNMVVKGLRAASKEQFDEYVDMMETRHAGVRNAYRTLYLQEGADATVVGSDLRQIDFKATQGAGETRISMLSRVHPVILGASEGLQGSSLNAGNFGAARRMWADSWIYPTLQDVAAAAAPLIRVPPDAELWTDTAGMPILREDASDAAQIEQTKASTMVSLINGGFTPESVVPAVESGDLSTLVHSGLISVQLQPPGAAPPSQGAGPPPTDAGPKGRPVGRSSDPDEEPDDGEEPDQLTWALVVALDELAGDAEEQRAFDPKKHPRNPKGSPGGGRFRSIVDLIKDALEEHVKTGGTGDPLANFTRSQLLKAARLRGFTVKRGASDDHIKKALIADLNKAAPALPAGVHLGPMSKPGLGGTADVYLNGAKIGEVHDTGSKKIGFWIVDSAGHSISGNFKTPEDAAIAVHDNYLKYPPVQAPPGSGPPGTTLVQWPSPFSSAAGAKSFTVVHNGVVVGDIHTNGHAKGVTAMVPSGAGYGLGGQVGSGSQHTGQAPAIKALVNAHLAFNPPDTTPKPVLPHVAGAPGVTATAIPARQGMFGLGKQSQRIELNGVPIGTIHQSSFGWTADDVHGNPLAFINSHSRTAAIKAVVTKHQAATAAAANAPVLPQKPVGRVGGPEIKAALDLVYGVDSKGAATHQIKVYGGLKKSHFDTLDVTEQTVILGDLGYITENSKGPSGKQAQKLIDRFTPAGTKLGTMPTPPTQVVGPANGTLHRLPTPQAGLLQSIKNSGIRGDEWLSGTGGGNVWGRYGSGGILLRHVDDKGVERFLMTQRGPGISDPGKWSYPGGAFESLEDPYQGATREVAEELGFTNADFAAAQVHGFHVFERSDVKAEDGKTGKTKPWTYHSMAATVPTQLKPDLTTHGALAETSDARWMTRAEIEHLDRQGMLHAPVAGGKLQRNVMSLFPSAVRAPGTRPERLAGPMPTLYATRHKPSLGRDLIPDQASMTSLDQTLKSLRGRFAGKTASNRLAAIGHLQGFDDTPTVVTKSEFDQLLATGDYIEVWRGVKGAGYYGGPTRGGAVSRTKTAAQMQEELRSGPAYYGSGMFGVGYYFATDRNVAQGYSDGSTGSLVRALIPKTARTQTHDKVEQAAHATGIGTFSDEGRYAAAKGLDGIEIRHSFNTSHIAPTANKPAFLVLNRSVLIVQEA